MFNWLKRRRVKKLKREITIMERHLNNMIAPYGIKPEATLGYVGLQHYLRRAIAVNQREIERIAEGKGE